MKKPFQNKGITAPCAWEDCRKPVVVNVNFLGFPVGEQDMICSHCKRPIRELIRQKTVIKIVKITAVSLIMVGTLTILTGDTVVAEKIKCSVFKTKLNAQAFFDLDPYLFRFLDRDKDGKACENLPMGFIVK